MLLSLRYRADKIRNLSRRSRGSAQADSHFALRNFFFCLLRVLCLRETSFLLKFFTNFLLTLARHEH